MPVPARTRSIARVIFAVALLGVLVVTHLGLQAQKGFSDGCTGFGDVAITADAIGAAPEAGGCGEVATGEYADFLGVSNIAWGLLFYVGLALLRLGYAASGNRSLRVASFAWATVGFAYTLYLVGLQAFVIGSYCVLCMTSAALVTLLFILHILEHRREMSGERHSAPPPTTKAALVPYGAIAGVFAILLLADVALAGGGEGDQPDAIAQAVDETPQDQPATLAPPIPQGCAFDPVFAPIADLSEFTDNPSVGSGGVTVVEVFDPNCPHCQSLHETLEGVKTATAQQATFYSVPFPLRPTAIGQAASLAWARESDAYFDLVDQFFARLDGSWGMTPEELRESANEVGLDGPSLIATLEDQEMVQPYLDMVSADSDAVQEHLSTPDGRLSTPKLVINGRVVANTNASLTESCLTQLIQEAAGSGGDQAAVVEEVQ